ncbi:Molybdopterin converting factor, small subunit [Roseomonas mucosa]|uniref:Molybdopterin synthase sulfur carrier subunit n=1 Tax=Roseomonas mucosa TaxID=207340 RepID=A0A379MV20_9PROT|nr:molybdopterin converting factor subunit 1 [Roseomonas mucosa]QDD96415.1 Molybdopterin converting factor, small subunit [Roseomonas mucosa]QDE01416.1 Molybdopterin converting factor, small subunit [Roseomonas mucosa]UZO93703.1 Molybdopterin converting factor, small subunit [Roseomonas mucosa]SUE37906.1 Sulfur carrier protein moaD [Roseomonas mucosa]
MIRVLYFAWLRQRTGLAAEEVEPPPEVATIGALMRWLAARSPGHAAAFAQPKQVRAAVNQEFRGPEDPIAPGDEVAFFPPVTGG